MSLLVANRITRSFGADTVLASVSFRLGWGEKLGLVGRNGSGKTTLLRILTGQLELDSGSVTYARGIRFGYLRQEQMVEHGWTVFHEAQDAFAPVLAMERRLRELEIAMASSSRESQLQSTLDEYGLLHERFEAMGGYESLRDIRIVLKRLGFGDADMDKATARLSGGEKTRLALAKLLLSAPDVLLLDEPTNHLDLEATEWLEGFLRGFGGAVLLVSHDRTFLDAVVSRVAEIEAATLTVFHGNFTSYWTQRQERRLRQAEVHEREQAEIGRLEDFWRRNKAGQNRNLAWSRLKMAERLRAASGGRPVEEKGLKVALREKVRSGNEVVIADRLTKRFGERTLFEDVSFLVTRGMRIGVVGPNGAGKSTLVRILVGREPASGGSARLGANVTTGYFAQEASDLDLDASVIESIAAVSEMKPGEARNYLARFLFTGDDVFRQVAELSGGEKNRLVLAQLVLARPNLLVLDEPTNHLDIDARSALVAMLKEYDGTVLLVSHDRYLLDEVTTHTLEVRERGAEVVEGSYTAYRRLRAAVPAPEADAAGAAVRRTRPRDANPLTAGMNSHQLARARRKAGQQVEQTERQVSDLEDWIRRIEESLSAPLPGEDVVRLSRDYERAQQDLHEAMRAWEEALEYAEAIGASA
ncbi:MAG: ATP-binding cassette domain-containing protein [Chthonomonadales bacterium]|nr:ATP-binding cassette domain-containing protein [Chthonomonadales bacterium]